MNHIAQYLWVSYLVIGFLVLPALFWLRYRRSSIVTPLWPKTRYDWIEHGAGHAYVLFTISLFLWSLDPAPFPTVALLLWASGVILQVWSIVALGPHWRIGQDEQDASCEYVARGPYAVIAHPIYWSIALVMIGLVFAMGLDARIIALVCVNALYSYFQIHAESARWEGSR